MRLCPKEIKTKIKSSDKTESERGKTLITRWWEWHPLLAFRIPVLFPDNKHPAPSAHGNEPLPLFAVYVAFLQLYHLGWAHEFDLTNPSIKFSWTLWWTYCWTNMEAVTACVCVCMFVCTGMLTYVWGSEKASMSLFSVSIRGPGDQTQLINLTCKHFILLHWVIFEAQT